MRDGIDQLEARTKQFAIDGIGLCRVLSGDPSLWNLTSQLSDASGSVASNHRAMRRARSRREFAAKLQTVCEEADECVLWLEVAGATARGHGAEIASLLAEARELRAIFSKARGTTRGGL